MRTSLFKKAKKLIDMKKVTLNTQTPKSLYFRVESMNGKDYHDVRLEYKDYTLNHSCTCPHMTLSKPWNLCAHKLACMVYMSTLEPTSVEEI